MEIDRQRDNPWITGNKYRHREGHPVNYSPDNSVER